METPLMPSPPPHLTQPAAAATTTLSLTPRGVPDAVDAEMSGVSGDAADVWDAEVGPAPTSSSGPTSTSSSRWDSTDTVAHAQSQSSAESAALGKRRLKAKEKKRRQKARRSAETTRAQRGEGKEEAADGAGQDASSQTSTDYGPQQWRPAPGWDGRSEGSEEMEESEVSDRSEWDAEIGCESPPRRAWGYM